MTLNFVRVTTSEGRCVANTRWSGNLHIRNGQYSDLVFWGSAFNLRCVDIEIAFDISYFSDVADNISMGTRDRLSAGQGVYLAETKNCITLFVGRFRVWSFRSQTSSEIHSYFLKQHVIIWFRPCRRSILISNRYF